MHGASSHCIMNMQAPASSGVSPAILAHHDHLKSVIDAIVADAVSANKYKIKGQLRNTIGEMYDEALSSHGIKIRGSSVQLAELKGFPASMDPFDAAVLIDQLEDTRDANPEVAAAVAESAGMAGLDAGAAFATVKRQLCEACGEYPVTMQSWCKLPAPQRAALRQSWLVAERLA
jgi:hypothetical protein